MLLINLTVVQLDGLGNKLCLYGQSETQSFSNGMCPYK